MIGTCLDHSFRSDRYTLWSLRRRKERGGHSPAFPWFLLFAQPWPNVPEDLHNEQVDGEHEEGALEPNHHLLPGKLDLTWQDQVEKKHLV